VGFHITAKQTELLQAKCGQFIVVEESLLQALQRAVRLPGAEPVHAEQQSLGRVGPRPGRLASPR